MTRTLLTAASCAALIACGTAPVDANKDGIADGIRAPDAVSQVAPSSPVGTVSGRVTTSKFLGLEGADVVMVLGGKSDGAGSSYKTTTDTEGNFAFKDVPAGSSAQVFVSKAGFTAMRTQAYVPASAGQFPLNDGNGNVGNIVLLELNGTVRFNVFTSNGKPARGAKALMEVSPAGYVTTSSGTYGTPSGVTSFSATVDDMGLLSFTGVVAPEEMARTASFSTAYTVTIGAWDENGDGTVEALGTVQSYSGSALFTSGRPNIMLSEARTSAQLGVIATNVETLMGGNGMPFRNAVWASEPIYVVFNQPIIEATLEAKVVDEDCFSPVAVNKSVRGGNVLMLTPATAWVQGAKYNIIIRAVGLDSGSTAARLGYFFGATASQPKALGTQAAFLVTKASGNMNNAAAESGDTISIVLDSPTRYFGGGQARLFYNFDINNNATIGGTGDSGEYGSPFATGFAISSDEPQYVQNKSTFGCAQSFYTTRYTMTASIPRPDGVSIGTPVKLTFPRDQSTAFGYHTIWGASFSGDITGTLSLAP